MSDDAKPEEETDAPEDETGEELEVDEEGEGEAEGEPQGKFAGKMKFIIIGVVALVLIGGGAGLYFSGIFHKERPHETTVMLPGPPVYYEMQRITVDLKPSATRARPFIRVTMQVELQGESAKTAFIDHEIKIMDGLTSHLREVQPEELSGKEGTERLREDFVIIINRIIAPEVAITVLYKDIMVR